MIPYLEGPKTALWSDIRKRIMYEPIFNSNKKAKRPSDIVTTSRILVAKMMLLLLYLSAKTPEGAEKRRNGEQRWPLSKQGSSSCFPLLQGRSRNRHEQLVDIVIQGPKTG